MKTVLSLNGEWKFVPTHDQKPNNNHNVIESSIPLYASPRLNRLDWETVPVPGVWQRYAEKYSVYEGVCWFYREFECPDLASADRVRLVFKGVNYRADVYVNGRFVGAHESAYTEFFFDITDALVEGTNAIAVQVDNRPIIVKWPNDWGYGVYGGIHRDVFLELYNGNYLSDVAVTPDYADGQAVLTVKGTLQRAGTVTVRVGDTVSAVTVEDDGVLDTVLRYDGITPWCPRTPALYPVTVSVDGEVYFSADMGFRHISCHQRKLFLNGQEIRMNGACYVYDSPQFGLVMDEAQLLADLTKMKEANVNAIRTHYPMSDGFYRLCDKMGFMVWIEPNVYCSKPANTVKNTVFSQPDMIDAAVSMIHEMIDAARPFAGVVIYGIGNECNTEHPEARAFFETLATVTRQRDNTRLVGYASLFGQIGTIGDLVDIMGVNSYFGWYDNDLDSRTEDGTVRRPVVDPLFSMVATMETKLPAGTPILLTEFGADSNPGYYSDDCELWSENYHAAVVEKYIEASRTISSVVGTFVFAFTDYNDPSKPTNGHWNGLNLKGMLSYDRQVKLPFYALKKAYETT